MISAKEVADKIRDKVNMGSVPPAARHFISMAHDVAGHLGLPLDFFHVGHVMELMHAEGIKPEDASNEYPKHVKVGTTTAPDERGVETERDVFAEVNDADEEAAAIHHPKDAPADLPPEQQHFETVGEEQAPGPRREPSEVN